MSAWTLYRMKASMQCVPFGRVGRFVFAGVLVLGILAPRADAARRSEARLELEFMWREASSLAASASTEADFMRVAERYRVLSRDGASNGVLYYNLGTALLKAGHSEAALNALARAERHMGSRPEIRRNMRLALAGDRDPADVFLPWYRLFLFWHYQLGFWLRLLIAGSAFAVVWLCMMLRVSGWTPSPLRWVQVTAGIVFVLYSSSVGASLLQERRDRVRDRLMESDEIQLSRLVQTTGQGGCHG